MTNVGRRHFLGGLLSAALCERLLGKTTGDPTLRIGFISDSHVCLMMPDNNKAFEKALAYLAARNVDVVVISGDVTEFSTPEELQIVIDTWNRAFPGGRAADGRTTAKFIAWGNHDYACASYMGRMTKQQLRGAFPRMLIDEKAFWWERICGEDFPGEVFSKTFNGIPFVGAHWGHEEESVDWMKAHPEAVDVSKFFVHVEHPHPPKTVYDQPGGPKAVRKFLNAHPNCLSLSGHSHLSAADSRALWRGSFTAMTGSTPSRHAMVLGVYPDRLLIERRDLKHDGPAGPDWALPFPLVGNPAAPFDHPVANPLVV